MINGVRKDMCTCVHVYGGISAPMTASQTTHYPTVNSSVCIKSHAYNPWLTSEYCTVPNLELIQVPYSA